MFKCKRFNFSNLIPYVSASISLINTKITFDMKLIFKLELTSKNFVQDKDYRKFESNL